MCSGCMDWNNQDVSVIQILREINFQNSEPLKWLKCKFLGPLVTEKSYYFQTVEMYAKCTILTILIPERFSRFCKAGKFRNLEAA